MSASPTAQAPAGRTKLVPQSRDKGAAPAAGAVLGHDSDNSSPERATELPDGWRWARLDEIANVVRGSSPRPAGDPRYFGGDIPWITVGPITSDNTPYLRTVPQTVTPAGRERSRFIEAGTLLLTNSGATLGVPKISLVGGCINDGVAAFLGVPGPLKLYLLYFLHTQTQRLRGVNQGAAQPNLNTRIIKSIVVPLAPECEQRQIVAEIEKQFTRLEAGVAALRRVQANLKRYRAAVLRLLRNAGFSSNHAVGNAPHPGPPTSDGEREKPICAPAHSPDSALSQNVQEAPSPHRMGTTFRVAVSQPGASTWWRAWEATGPG